MRSAKPARPLAVSGTQAVDEYIAAAPKVAQPMMRQIREAIRAVCPDAEERLSYRMPYYAFHGRLVYYAVSSKHVGVYLMGRSKEQFARELKPWRTTPTTMRLPFGERVPVALLKRVIRARAAENLASVGELAARIRTPKARDATTAKTRRAPERRAR